MKELTEEITENPSQYQLFRLGHLKELFATYGKTVNEQWPEFLASRYHALTLQFDRTLRQSSLWREFTRNATMETFTTEQVVEAGMLAEGVAGELRAHEAADFVNPTLPASIERLSELASQANADKHILSPQIQNSSTASERLAIDIVEGINNTLKRISEAALQGKIYVSSHLHDVSTTLADGGKDYAENLGKGFKKAARKQGLVDGENAFKWLRRVTITGGTGVGISQFISSYPSKH